MKIFGFEIWPEKTRACRYNPPFDAGLDLIRGPHCDPYVLHGPQECLSCDECVDAQAERIHKAINFTGQDHPGRATCPAEQRRTLVQIHSWGGNRPVPRDDA